MAPWREQRLLYDPAIYVLRHACMLWTAVVVQLGALPHVTESNSSREAWTVMNVRCFEYDMAIRANRLRRSRQPTGTGFLYEALLSSRLIVRSIILFSASASVNSVHRSITANSHRNGALFQINPRAQTARKLPC